MIRYGSFLLLGILLAGGCRHDGGEKTLAVTSIANEGYLISMGRTNVLIDALPMSKYYANPSDTLATRIINGVPPFDNVDYFLVTHEHSDHFNAEMTSRFLQNHPATQLIANQETCSRLNADSAGARTIL